MGTMATVRVDTTQQMIIYRDFVIEESTEGWEWTHDNFGMQGDPNSGVTGTCQAIFECIDAVDAWHEE